MKQRTEKNDQLIVVAIIGLSFSSIGDLEGVRLVALVGLLGRKPEDAVGELRLGSEDAPGEKFGAPCVEVDVVLKEVADVTSWAVVVWKALPTELGVSDLAVLAVIGDHAEPALVKLFDLTIIGPVIQYPWLVN